MATIAKVAAAVAKYGSKAVSWVWAHKDIILKYINAGLTVAQIIDLIKGFF